MRESLKRENVLELEKITLWYVVYMRLFHLFLYSIFYNKKLSTESLVLIS